MKISSIIVSVYRRVCLGKMKIAFISLCLMLAFMCAVFAIPVRNMVFYPVMEYAWMDIPTLSLLGIHYSQEVIPYGLYHNVVCFELRQPTFNRSFINVSTILAYPAAERLTMEMLGRQYGNFLPTLNTSQKVDHLFLYAVLAEALEAVQVEHFLVAGSLLGVMRHGGFIPWDDDIDISINITQWQLVKQTLSCIKGFDIFMSTHLHWKFQFNGSVYPFIDIFFYQMGDIYIWSLTNYIRKTYIYPTKYVFPLSTGVFEGLRVPIPHDPLSIVKRIYNYDSCNAYTGHIEGRNQTLLKEYPCAYSVHRVDCAELSYIYKMSHLHDS